ncbi:hypothetical protein UCDDA912_g01065 [Diaporthe ampelina]|uniref:Uncharacterized protein n=1 Tax=Diaporthe ampelina TaxID=1214573 RepID=A0A0G2IFL3_9PEZI|nr:hypothetical protein UCDDA912_g01065 [Diaporthe ampelina]
MASKSDNPKNGAAPATPKAAAAGGGYSSLTAREQEILAKAMTCLKTAPEIDFPKLAAELNMNNHRSAVNAWSIIRRKMGWNFKVPDSPADGKTPAAGKASGAGKRKMAVVNEEEADDDEETAAPAKRAKVAPKSRKKLPSTPKKGQAAAAPESPVAAKGDSEENKVGSEDKADTEADTKEENDDGEV